MHHKNQNGWSAVFVLIAWSISAFAHEGRHEPARSSREGLARSQVEMTIESGVRLIRSNGIPAHTPGAFPNRGNPHTITEQKYEFRMPASPKRAEESTPVARGCFGVALDGVPLDPGTNEYWGNDRRLGWRYEAMAKHDRPLGLDESHAHVQPNGAYHYHGISPHWEKSDSKVKMTLVGYAADGFPIYLMRGHSQAGEASSPLKVLKSSYRLKAGERPNGPGGKYDGTYVQDYEYVAGLGDLDECHGRSGVTPEYPQGIYYYVVTEDFPFIPRYFRGTPDPSFLHQGFGPPGGGARGGFPPPYPPPFPPPR